jgi:thioredoxin reductase
LGDRIAYALPDVLGADRATYDGAHTLLVGAGASAATTACALASLDGARVTWVTRRSASDAYADIPDDPLPERVALRTRARALLQGSGDRVTHVGGAGVDRFARTSDGRVRATLTNGRSIDVDRVVAHTGLGPDNAIYRELQVHECYATRGPMALAAALEGASAADCLSTPAFGADALATSEPRFFILGHKSYGTSPHFLLETGYAQVADDVPRLQNA